MDMNYIEKRNEITKKVKELLIESLGLNMKIENIETDVPLFGPLGLGLDSVDALELVLSIEKEYNIMLGDNVQKILYSVNTIVDYIMKNHE
ncbi:phosphopantetheine-binding protein [Arcobacter vandammei]|uniref:phosphopantetheine-binding protein n=1 Tax=Arcobacter vandammei TaxID=2782243 RepID=UPI001D1989C9|nr:phosphopantetheine-binding protein [Arcobacter vandammei]